jgi:hypothetical protein
MPPWAFRQFSAMLEQGSERKAHGEAGQRHGVFEFWFAAEDKDSDPAWQRRQACQHGGKLASAAA